MIAVIGDLQPRTPAAGLAPAIAEAASRRGHAVQVVGVVAPDATGDARMVHFAEAGVGHAAVLRSPAASLDPADLELALRYLPDLAVLVLVGEVEALGPTAGAAAAFAQVPLVAVASAAPSRIALPDDALVLGAPDSDPDGAFAGLVAELAAELDGGATPSVAWDRALRRLGVEASGR